MRKFLIFTVFLSLLLCLCSSCSKKCELGEYVSLLRSDIFYGESDNYLVKGYYEQRESPLSNDGKVKNKISYLVFTLPNRQSDSVNYSLCFDHNDKSYQLDFKLDPVTHTLSALAEIDEWSNKEFIVYLKFGGQSLQVNMHSTLPQNTISYLTALEKLKEKQKNLIDSYRDESGTFKGEIHVRVLTRENNPYYYVGLISSSGDLKALLIDGLSGELLAIREVF